MVIMANRSINLAFHHGSMLPSEPATLVLRPVRLFANFHSFSATGAVTTSASKSLRVSPGRWGCSASPCCCCCCCCCFHFRGCSCKWKRLVRSGSASEFVIASDENYGNKQVVSLTPRLYDYVLKNVREPEVKIEEHTL